ncbi:HAMP domain-containing histidine kinase [Streptococcus lutetiensis]|uniref:HAMP domain-containing sensor histidine kinase n=1 Tax=Streptococcus lutetiensis TaxID=150055 RepID=UPI001BDA7B23|nr:HAMP domain-containing histidine kinase [Streptococcus lutetiensis]MBT0906106.1 HAMP domain-containing histidine kinase [Streptococcus lutetiensis]
MIKYFKKSLSKKISLTSLQWVLVILSVSNLLIYFGVTQIFLERDRYNTEQATEVVRELLSKETSLTEEKLLDLLEQYNATGSLVEEGNKTYIFDKQGGIDDLVFDNQDVSVFNKNKQLVLTTNKVLSTIKIGKVSETTQHRSSAFNGFYQSEKVYSKDSREVIGYVTVYQDLTTYYMARHVLVLILLVSELIEACLIFKMLLVVSHRSLKPLGEFQAFIDDLSENPSDLSLRSDIKSGDEIERLSMSFDNMLEQIEGYARRQTRFVSDVSHELRTPIAVIKGHLGLLQRWGKDDPEILCESLDAAYHEADRMSIMVNDMLDMVRVQGSFDLHKGEITDLKQSIDLVLGNFRILYPDFRFSLTSTIDDCIYAEIYKDHFEQAILILIDNGVKYSSGSRNIHVTLDVLGDDAIVKVRDEGEGISQEDLNHIFKRFYRTDKSRNRVSTQGGLGIGLAILKQIVDAYNLKVSVSSVVDEGTEFTLVIPRVMAK